MKTASAFYGLSGFRYDRCVVLGQRWDTGRSYSNNQGEFWAMALRPAVDAAVQGKLQLCHEHLVAGTWLDNSGTCFLPAPDGTVHVNKNVFADGASEKWKATGVIDATPGAIWGSSPRFVVVAGLSKKDGKVFRYDGKAWHELPPPGFNVHAIHGVSEKLFAVVGEGGGIAVWNGSGWAKPKPLTKEQLNTVCVVSTKEIYAAGDDGKVFVGDAKGPWKLDANVRPAKGRAAPVKILAVTKFKDAIWVGAGLDGLYRRGNKEKDFTQVKPNLHVSGFDARGDALLMVVERGLVETQDGESYLLYGEHFIDEARKGKNMFAP